MSRSNQTEIINPAFRFLEWNGEKGVLKFYDKQLDQKIEIDPNITFILLDQLAVIKGWNDASESGIYSNEVKDITKNPFTVKSFKGGHIATGLYKDIKDKITANGGHFTANLYIAIKEDEELKIASIQLKGAALNAWIEFVKKNRNEIYTKAIVIDGVESGLKGRVTYKIPVFKTKPISDETNNIAKSLDIDLQDYLKLYFAKNTHDQVIDVEPKEVLPTITQPKQDDDDLPF